MPYDRGKVEGSARERSAREATVKGRRGDVLGAGYPGGVEGSVFDRASLRRAKERRGGVLGAGYPGGVEGSAFDRVSLRREKGRGVGDLDVSNLSSKSFTMEETHASLSHDTNDI